MIPLDRKIKYKICYFRGIIFGLGCFLIRIVVEYISNLVGLYLKMYWERNV